MTEETELLELLLEEVAQKLGRIEKAIADIRTETLGQDVFPGVIPSREEIRKEIRVKIIRWLDYIKHWHGDRDDYTAMRLGVTVHAIQDEWRKEGGSLPNLRNHQALKVLFNAERRLHGEPED